MKGKKKITVIVRWPKNEEDVKEVEKKMVRGAAEIVGRKREREEKIINIHGAEW